MKKALIYLSVLAAFILNSCVCGTSKKTACNDTCKTTARKSSCCPKTAHNTLTSQEKSEGWQLLFDGKSTKGWHGYQGEDISGIWVVEDGCLKALGKAGDIGGDILTEKEFGNFELKLEWKITHGGNSGIFYGVIDDPKYKAVYYTGPEYQLLDDVGFPTPLDELYMAGANYAMHAADRSKKKLQMANSPCFNTSRIVVDGEKVEHWLNGERIVAFKRWNSEWTKMKSKSKWKDFPDYGMAKKGKIAFQDHGDAIWIRNIKIKEL